MRLVEIVRSMSPLSLILPQTLLNVALTVAVTTTPLTTSPLTCPSKCSCVQYLTCRDLGEQNYVMDFSTVGSTLFSYFSFDGRTKVRTIQAGAFSGLSVNQLRLDRSGIRHVEDGAFLGVKSLLYVDVQDNHISGVINRNTFAVDTSLVSLNISGNDIEAVTNDVFSIVGGPSVRELRLARNRLSTLPDGVFANLTWLEQLHLSGNQLDNVTRPQFEGLNNLRSLFLADNRISHIDRSVFDSMTQLQQLALDNNELSSLPAFLFIHLSNLQTLSLGGNRLTAFDSAIFPTQFTSLTTLKLDRNRISNLANVQLHNISTVTTLSLAANRLSSIPARYFVGFSYMNDLDLSRNNISGTLNESTFEGLMSLNSLNLSSNNIKRIISGTFGASIRSLDLSDNDYIEHLEPGTFSNATSLTKTSLRSNSLFSVQQGVFRNISLLEELDLADNFISSFSSASFEDLPSLTRVDLSKNNIYYLPTNVFVNTSTLRYVDLSENHLSVTQLDLMSALPNIQNFTVAHNDIPKLQKLSSPSVFMLNFTGNFITDIVDGAFNLTPRVRQLYLGQNLLTTIRSRMFAGMQSLNLLDLSDNLISSIDNGSFQDITFFYHLNLHGNRITVIEQGMFSGLYGMYSLDLSANRLVNFTGGLNELSYLGELILDDNDIRNFYIDTMNVEGGLYRLSIRRNLISSLQINSDIYHLDLGENSLTNGIFSSLQHLRVVQTLKLDGNDISNVPVNSLLNVAVAQLELSNNALTDDSLPAIVQARQLRQLKLDGNSIGNLSSSVDWSLLANSLEVLSLANNRLRSIEDIGKLWSLTHLNLDYNHIESIPVALFQQLYVLEVVSLRGNLLTSIGLSTLNWLEQACLHLDLSSNHIASVHPGAFHRLKNIKHVNISNNNISVLVLPPIMNQLTELMLDNNQLTRFPDGLLIFQSISTLSLRNNLVDIMPTVNIGNKFGVGLVDLSHNQLRNVDALRLAGSLNVVDLSDNQLRDISTDVLTDVTFITELKLSRNPLGKLPDVVVNAVTHISRLFADKCALLSLDNWAIAPWLATRLTELILTGNRLTILSPTVVASVHGSLEHLDIRGNLLSTLDSNMYLGSWTPLRRLSLAGNPWRCDCRLAWLRALTMVNMDRATCWTPPQTASELLVCYEVNNTCIIPRYGEQLRPRSSNSMCESQPTVPVVNNVWPLFGPQSGGTLVTITGSNFGESQEPVIVFASSASEQFITLPTNSTVSASERSRTITAIGRTPKSNNTGEDLLILLHFTDRPLVNASQYFVYRNNPDVIDIFPLTHLLSGGTTVTVVGNNMDAAAQPFITITLVITRHSERSARGDDRDSSQITTCNSEPCNVINSSVMTCTMPPTDLPNDFLYLNDTGDVPSAEAGSGVLSLYGGPYNRDRADLYVGLLFDGYRDYANLTAATPQVQFQFFLPPTFDGSTTVIVYRPQSFSDIDVTGKNLQRGTRITDYRVLIGNGTCSVSSLSDNLLTCRPPFHEPDLEDDDLFCDDLNSVQVYVGNAGPFLIACVLYETDNVNVSLIVGIVVGLVLFFLLVLLAVVCVYRLRRRREKLDYQDEEIPPVIESQSNDATSHSAQFINPVYSQSTENVLPASSANGYFEPITDDEYLGRSNEICDNDGYLMPMDDTPGQQHPPPYIVPLPSPTTENHQHLTCTENILPANGTNGYFEPITDDEYLGRSAETCDNDGYLMPVDDSHGQQHPPPYIVPLPSPTPPFDSRVIQPPPTRDVCSVDQKSLADSDYLTPCENDETEKCIEQSAVNNSSDANTNAQLQLQYRDTATANTNSARVSSLADDLKLQYELAEVNFSLPSLESVTDTVNDS